MRALLALARSSGAAGLHPARVLPAGASSQIYSEQTRSFATRYSRRKPAARPSTPDSSVQTTTALFYEQHTRVDDESPAPPQEYHRKLEQLSREQSSLAQQTPPTRKVSWRRQGRKHEGAVPATGEHSKVKRQAARRWSRESTQRLSNAQQQPRQEVGSLERSAFPRRRPDQTNSDNPSISITTSTSTNSTTTISTVSDPAPDAYNAMKRKLAPMTAEEMAAADNEFLESTRGIMLAAGKRPRKYFGIARYAAARAQGLLVNFKKNGDLQSALALYRTRATFPIDPAILTDDDRESGLVDLTNNTVKLMFTSEMLALLMHMLSELQDDDSEAVASEIDSIRSNLEATGRVMDEKMTCLVLRSYNVTNRLEDAKALLAKLRESHGAPHLRTFTPVYDLVCRAATPDTWDSIRELYEDMYVTLMGCKGADGKDLPSSSSSPTGSSAPASESASAAMLTESSMLRCVPHLLSESEYCHTLRALARLGEEYPEMATNTVRLHAVNDFVTIMLKLHMPLDVPSCSPRFVATLAKLFTGPIGKAIGPTFGNSQRAIDRVAKRDESAAAAAEATEPTAVGSWVLADEPLLLEGKSCRVCDHGMERVESDTRELEMFVAVLKQSATEGSREHENSWQMFEGFLAANEYDTVVDGANVGYYGTSRELCYVAIDGCMNALIEQGRKPLLILHSRHFSKRALSCHSQARNGHSSPAAIVDKWVESGRLFKVPFKSNDDWYWMYAAMRRMDQTMLVSNDQLRDHSLAMQQSRIFRRWREQHMANFHWFFAKGGRFEFELFKPLPYTVCIQGRVTGGATSGSGPSAVWHLPMTTEEQQEPRQQQQQQHVGDDQHDDGKSGNKNETQNGDDANDDKVPAAVAAAFTPSTHVYHKDNVSKWIADQHKSSSVTRWACLRWVD